MGAYKSTQQEESPSKQSALKGLKVMPYMELWQYIGLWQYFGSWPYIGLGIHTNKTGEVRICRHVDLQSKQDLTGWGLPDWRRRTFWCSFRNGRNRLGRASGSDGTVIVGCCHDISTVRVESRGTTWQWSVCAGHTNGARWCRGCQTWTRIQRVHGSRESQMIPIYCWAGNV